MIAQSQAHDRTRPVIGGAALIDELDQTRDQIWRQIWDQIWHQTWDQTRDGVSLVSWESLPAGDPPAWISGSRSAWPLPTSFGS